MQDAGLPWQQLCAGLSNLTSLLLGHNQLQVLPASLSQLTGLVQLDLQHNQLSSVEPGAFEGLCKLEVLQLQDNQLQQLPDSLGAHVQQGCLCPGSMMTGGASSCCGCCCVALQP